MRAYLNVNQLKRELVAKAAAATESFSLLDLSVHFLCAVVARVVLAALGDEDLRKVAQADRAVVGKLALQGFRAGRAGCDFELREVERGLDFNERLGDGPHNAGRLLGASARAEASSTG